MNPQGARSKIRGCILGAALGDAIGGPFEFGPLERVPTFTGGDWIDGLYPYLQASGPHGVWAPPTGGRPPAGTGTDDTRLNWLFLDLATELNRMPSGQEIAVRYLEAYERPESIFAGHVEMARLQFEHWEPACRGYLGQRSKVRPDLTPDLLLARSLGLNYPILSGLIALTWAGLLFPGRPAEAYTEAFRVDFYDIGYAREAVALLAAAVSIAVAEEITPQALYERIAVMDPLRLGGPFSAPFVIGHLPQVYPLAAEPRADQEVARALSKAFRHDHAFDAFRTFAVGLLAVVAARGDPLRAILIAANHVGLDEEGHPTRYEDIDCYACIAGAIAGAIAGEDAFPADMLDRVVQANAQVYGFDLSASADRFVDRFAEALSEQGGADQTAHSGLATP